MDVFGSSWRPVFLVNVPIGAALHRRSPGGLAAQALATVTYAALLFVLANYLQRGLGKGPLYSGFAVLSWVVGFGVSGPMLRGVPQRFSARISVFGFTLLGAVFLAIAAEGHFSVPQGAPLVALLGLGGLGMGTGFSSLIGHLTATVRLDVAPDLSGVVSTNSELASALGVAVFGTLYLALAQDHHPTIAIDAFAPVAASLGGVALLAAAAAWRSVRNGRVRGVQRHPPSGKTRHRLAPTGLVVTWIVTGSPASPQEVRRGAPSPRPPQAWNLDPA